MALRNHNQIMKRLFGLSTATASTAAAARSSVTSPPASNAARSFSRRDYVSSPDVASRGYFRRFLQRRTINQASLTPARIPPFLAMPLVENLREKLRETRIAGIEINRPSEVEGDGGGGMAVENLKRLLRFAQVKMVKEKLRSEEESTVTYAEYVRICVDACRSETQGMEMAKLLDDSANVIVWGNAVFLRPDKLAKSMEAVLWQSVGLPNDPRRKELEEMEKVKAQIDSEAQSLVRKELYCGLGLMMAQTVGFMRLTFWELSWDVMEPICFFVTSIHFGLAYGFFLRTSTEPSFEGYFKRRFESKQAKIMKARKFDLDKYEKLRNAFYQPAYA